MRLLRPDMAAWLLAVPVVTILWFFNYRYKRRSRIRSASGPTGMWLSRRTGGGRDRAVLALSMLVVALLSSAMMRPQIRSERRTPSFERSDLIVILDRSLSMRARDIAPSRFGRAVDEIQTFLRHKPDAVDRVALIGFAASSVVLSYPTDDVDSLSFYLDWLRDDPTPLFGTDIGAALTSALAASRRERQRVAPVFVLVSDGDDEGGKLVPAATALTRAGIRVHCIGIGSQRSVPMPVPTGGGREEFLRDDSGNLVTTRFQEATLRQLAELTGGRYFRSETGAELLSALDSIVRDERRQVGWTTTVEYRDLYLPLLAAAAILSVGVLTLI